MMKKIIIMIISIRFGMEAKIVDIRIFNFLIFEIVFKGLKIQTNRRAVTLPLRLSIKILNTYERTRTTKSKMFQMSQKYPL